MSWADQLTGLLDTYGLLAVFGCVALEAMGLPLPGETMLIAAAAYAGHTGQLGFGAVLATAAAAAIVGDNAGYAVGRYGGWPLLRRYGRLVGVDQSHVKVGRYLFTRHGGTVVFAGRFVSVLRAWASFLAGVNHMGWRRFLVCNAAGGLVWASLWTTTAYVFGAQLHRVSGPAQVAVLVLVGVVVVAGIVVARWRWRRLHTAAEAAYPGQVW